MPATVLSLVPEKIKIKQMQNTDAEVEFQILKGDGTPRDLTNHAVKFTAKSDYGGTVMIETKTNAVGEHTDPTEGKTMFVITKDDTTTDTPADEVSWVYEVRLVEGNGQESVYVYGELALVPVVGTDA
jgi:hypothetical protein